MSGMYNQDSDSGPSYGGGGVPGDGTYGGGSSSRGSFNGRGGSHRGGGGSEYAGGGDRGGRHGGRGGGRGPRDGDWLCPKPGCGNSNFARRTECNRCGTPAPGGGGASRGHDGGRDYNKSSGGGYGYGNNRGGRGNHYEGNRSGGSHSNAPPSYGDGGNYPPPYGGSSSHGTDQNPAEAPKLKQCDGSCDETCENSRIYISNLPPDVTVDELRDLFGGIGQVGRIKQKRGYKDQWPWNIKIYTDEKGNNKGDAVLSYEDPSAAHSAGGFYNEFDLRGYKINVAMAEKTQPKSFEHGGGRGGGYGGYGGGERRRDSHREGSGPDRHQHGGSRSRPY